MNKKLTPMLRPYYLILAFLVAVPCLFSCAPSDEEELQEVQIDKNLIVGHWVNKSNSAEHWRYESMNSQGTGTGVYWDTSEMSYEDAAKGPGLFQYHFNSTGLMRIYWMETTQSFSNPDTEAPFIIDVLNSSTMTYHPSGSSRSYSFSRK